MQEHLHKTDIGLRLAVFAAAVFGVTCIAFLQAVDYGLVNFDDYLYVERIPRGFNGWFSDLSCGIWMPFTWASYSLDQSLFGSHYGCWHLTSILIHGVNAVLVCVFFARLLKRRQGSGDVRIAAVPVLVALLWAVHPLRVESVVALSSRKDVLSLLFEMTALIAWLEGRKDWDMLACGFFVLGSFCKPSVMTFPLLCLVVDVFVIRRLELKRYAFPVLYAAFLGLFAAYQQKAGGATVDMFREGLLPRLVDAASAFGIYVRNIAWPQWLAPQCMKKFPLMPHLWGWGLLSTCIVGCICIRRSLPSIASAFRQLKSRRLVLDFEREDLVAAGLAWFIIAVAPMLGIANFGFHAFADRFTYIPAIGLGFLVVAAFEWTGSPRRRSLLCAVAALAVVALGLRTWQQTAYWKDDGALFGRTLEVDGEPNAVAHASLGAYHFEFTHDLEKCAEHFALAEKQDIRFMMIAFNVYVFGLCELGRTDEIPRLLSRFREVWDATTGHDRDSALDRRFKAIHIESEIAYLASEAGNVEKAERMLNHWYPPGMRTGPIVPYLRWRIALRKGDERGAARALDELSGHANGKGYLKFRYMNLNNAGTTMS